MGLFFNRKIIYFTALIILHSNNNTLIVCFGHTYCKIRCRLNDEGNRNVMPLKSERSARVKSNYAG